MPKFLLILSLICFNNILKAQLLPTIDSLSKMYFFDKKGNIKKEYNDGGLEMLLEGMFVSTETSSAIMDSLGNIIIPTKGIICISKPKNGRIKAFTNTEEGWYHYLTYYNYKGEKTFSLEKGQGGDFHEGLAPVLKNEAWGFINMDGEWKIPPKFHIEKNQLSDGYDCDIPSELMGVGKFSEGKAHIKQGDSWGFINRKGEWIILPKYQYAASFQCGIAAVVQNDMLGYIDTLGNWVIPPVLDALFNRFDYEKTIWERFFCSEDIVAARIKGKWAYYNSIGKSIIEHEYSNLTTFKEGLGMVYKDDLVGLVDKNGLFIMDCEWSEMAVSKAYNWILVSKNGKFGFRDLKNQILTDLEFDNAKYFINNFAPVAKNGKWGMIDRHNRLVIPYEYDDMKYFIEGLIPVKQNNKWGYINIKNELVIPYIFDDAHNFKNDIAVIEKFTKHPDGYNIVRSTYINKNGKLLTPHYFVKVLGYSDEMYDIEEIYGILFRTF